MVEQSDIALTDLPEATRNTVQDGLLVSEGGLDGARTRVDMLRGSLLVPCAALDRARGVAVPRPVGGHAATAAPTAGPTDPTPAPAADPGPTASPRRERRRPARAARR